MEDGEFMLFHELLDALLKAHQVKSSDICNTLSLKKAFFSRIRNGSLIPANFDLIDEIAGYIGMTPEEYRDLAYAYQEIKAEGRYKTACNAFRRLYDFHPKPITLEDEQNVPPFLNGQPLKNSSDVLDAVTQLIKSGDINAWYCPEQSNFTENLSLLLRKNHRQIQWLIPLDDTSSEKNMALFANALPLLCCGKETHCVRTEIEPLLSTAVFPYYFLSEDALILVGRKLDTGLYINSPETLTLYRERFTKSQAAAQQFADVRTDLMEFFRSNGAKMVLANTEEDTEFYVIERNPCILFSVKYSDISHYIADIPGAQELAKQYFTFLQDIFDNVKQSYTLFSSEGLQEIIHAEDYYELSEYLTKSVPVEFRRTALRAVASYSSGESNYTPMLIRLPLFDQTCVRALNLWSDGRMIVLFTFSDGFYVLSLHDKSITSEMIGYYKTLIKCGLIQTKGETLEIMLEELDKAECN